MSGGSAQTIRRYSVELWQDLVLHGIRKSTFQHLTVNWNFNVLEMALKTLHIFPGSIQDTFIIYSSISHKHISRTYVAKRKNLDNRQSGNLQIPKPRVTNRCLGFSRLGKEAEALFVNAVA